MATESLRQAALNVVNKLAADDPRPPIEERLKRVLRYRAGEPLSNIYPQIQLGEARSMALREDLETLGYAYANEHSEECVDRHQANGRPKLSFRDLEIGQVIHDMHDGAPDFAKIFVEPVEVVGHIPLRIAGFDAPLSRYLQRFGGPGYLNKTLVVIGLDDVGFLKSPNVTLAWSYDDRAMGVFVLRCLCTYYHSPLEEIKS